VKTAANNAAPAAPAPPTPPRTVDRAAERLNIARAKIDSNLLEPALADLRQVLIDFPNSTAAAEGSYLSAEILEKLGRFDEAMAAHVEFGQRFADQTRIAASKVRLAELTQRSRRPNRDTAAAVILGDVIRTYPRTQESMRALQLKIRLDQRIANA